MIDDPETMAPIYEITITRDERASLSIDMAGATVERACDSALASAAYAFDRLQPPADRGPFVITKIVASSAEHDPIPIPPAFRRPIAGLDGDEIYLLILALRFLASRLEAPDLQAFADGLGMGEPAGPSKPDAINALTDRLNRS